MQKYFRIQDEQNNIKRQEEPLQRVPDPIKDYEGETKKQRKERIQAQKQADLQVWDDIKAGKAEEPYQGLNDHLKLQLHQEIENVGIQLGRKIIDVNTKDLNNINQTYLEIVKHIGVVLWPYVFGK